MATQATRGLRRDRLGSGVISIPSCTDSACQLPLQNREEREEQLAPRAAGEAWKALEELSCWPPSMSALPK